MADLAVIGFKAETSGLLRAEKGLDSLAKKGEYSEKRINKSVNNVNQSFSSLRTNIGLAGAALTALGSARLTTELISQTDAWKNINSQIRQVTKSEVQLVSVQKQLVDLSRDTRSDLTNTVDLYATLTRSTKDLGTSQAEILSITKTLNNLFVSGGKPISEVSGAIRQLSQGFAAGALRGDEFNSVAEGAPKIMDALSAALKMSRGELREFAATGGITAEVMIDALKDYSDVAQGLADQTTKTFGQSMEIASTNITQFVGESKSLNSAIDSLGGGIEEFTQNLDAFAHASTVAAGVIGVGLAGAYAKSTAAKLADFKATQAGLVATSNAAKVSLGAAKSEQALAASKVTGLKATVAALAGEMELEAVRLKAQISDTGRMMTSTRMAEIGAARLAITKQLTAAEAALVVSGNAVALSQQKVSATAAAASVSTRALGAATKFLLGPWGLLITAVGLGAAAFVSAESESEFLSDALERQKTEVEKLAEKYEKFSKARLGATAVEAQLKAIEVDKQRIALQEKLTAMQQFTGNRGTTNLKELELSSELNKLNEEAGRLQLVLDAVNLAFQNGLPAVKDYTELLEDAPERTQKISTDLTNMVLALEMQRQELLMSADAFEIYSLRMEAMSNGLSAIETDKLVELLKANQELEKGLEGVSLGDLSDEIDNFGGAWTRTGNAVVDAFGTMADAMDDHMARMSSIGVLQEKINEKRKDATVDQIELERLQMNLNFEKDKAEIAGMASISNHLGSLFDEKTAAAKGFAALSQMLAVAEIALSYQKISASDSETINHLGNEALKQESNALTAITSAFSAGPITGFIAGAAMIGIMASLLGGSFGGSFADPTEGRQESQGTGTLLGSDDKSSSLIDLQERFEDIQIDQLAELRGIKDGLTAIDNGIDLVTRNFIAGDFGSGSQFEGSSLDARGVREGKLLKLISGEFFGGTSEALVSAIFGKTTKEVTDSGIQFLAASLGDIIDGGITAAEAYFDITTTKKKLFGLVKTDKTSTETQGLGADFENQITAIFQNIGSTVSEAATLLGFDVTEAINNFTVDLGKISLEGLTGEEISEELSAVFGAAADDIASAAIPALSQYQEIGEGAFETLVRVAQEQAVFNDSIERLGFNLSELSNVMQIDVAQSLIGLTGGFENFSDLTNSFFDNFFSDSEQLAVLEASLSDVFSSLGFSLVTSREEFKNLISGIDITTDEGQRLLATLLEVNPALSEYIDELERIESKRASLTIELLELQGKSEEALAMQRAIELEALDESLKALQLLIYAEEDRALLLQTQESTITSAMSKLEQSIDLEKDRLQAVLDVAATARDVELERLDALRVALNAEKDLRQSALDDAQSAMEAAFNNEVSLIQKLAAERIQALTNERTEIASTASAMSSLVDKINGSLGLDGSTDLIGALASARSGDFTAAQNLDVSGLSNLGSSGFASASDMRIQQAINQNRLAEIGGLAGGKLSESEQLIASLDAQILATQEIADNEIEKLNNQLDSLLGIDSGILELNDSISAYQDAKMELDALNYEAELAKLDMLVESANEVYNLHDQNYNIEISRLDSILSTNLQLVNAAFNINDSILSVSNAIIGLQDSFAENAAYQREIAKNTQTTAAASKDAKLNGQDVRIVS